jgi:hypothetical protein
MDDFCHLSDLRTLAGIQLCSSKILGKLSCNAPLEYLAIPLLESEDRFLKFLILELQTVQCNYDSLFKGFLLPPDSFNEKCDGTLPLQRLDVPVNFTGSSLPVFRAFVSSTMSLIELC